jgi:hypothetical protein
MEASEETARSILVHANGPHPRSEERASEARAFGGVHDLKRLIGFATLSFGFVSGNDFSRAVNELKKMGL